jgi:large subunit ribosomal protein L21
MFAVIRTGGKQYRVVQDDVLDVERLDGDAGASITFGEVLLLGGNAPKSGAPLVSGASVAAEIVAQKRAPKVVAFKKKRRKNTHRKRGHRQHLTTVRITSISAG